MQIQAGGSKNPVRATNNLVQVFFPRLNSAPSVQAFRSQPQATRAPPRPVVSGSSSVVVVTPQRGSNQCRDLQADPGSSNGEPANRRPERCQSSSHIQCWQITQMPLPPYGPRCLPDSSAIEVPAPLTPRRHFAFLVRRIHSCMLVHMKACIPPGSDSGSGREQQAVLGLFPW